MVAKFCLNPKLFTLHHVQTSEPPAKNLLDVGNIDGGVQGGTARQPRSPNPIVQAPTAVTGFAIAYSVDGADGQPSAHIDSTPGCWPSCSASPTSCADCLDFTRPPWSRSASPSWRPTPST